MVLIAVIIAALFWVGHFYHVGREKSSKMLTFGDQMEKSFYFVRDRTARIIGTYVIIIDLWSLLKE